MPLFKREVPLTFISIIMVIVIFSYFLNIPQLSTASSVLLEWVTIVCAFALFMALVNVLVTHGKKVIDRKEDWYYSLLVIVPMIVTMAVGLIYGIGHLNYQWIMNNVLFAIEAGLSGLFVFYTLSACYRTFSIKNWPSALLVISAIVAILSGTPTGELLHKNFSMISSWIESYPSMAAARGYRLLLTMGGLVLGIRMILRMEKQHLGIVEEEIE